MQVIFADDPSARYRWRPRAHQWSDLTDLALYPSEAIETPQHADEIILLCSIIHGSDILRYGSFGCGCAVPRVAPPTLSNLLGLKPSKSARCHAQSCSQRAHNPMSDDATPVRSF
jgi:hypothetical protein